MKASVIIATFNREQKLIDTIECILSNTYPDFELIVVDQTKKHSPRVESELESFGTNPRFKCIHLPIANLPLARNVGLRRAEGNIIIYVDDDVKLKNNFIANHMCAYRDRTVGAVGGRILTKGYDPDNDFFNGPYIGRLGQFGPVQGHFYRDGPQCEIEWGMGCNMSFRRDALMKVGGFDERYTGSAKHEDVDVFVRVRRIGYKAVFSPAAQLIHLKAAGGGCRSDDAFRRRRCSMLRSEALIASCINPALTFRNMVALIKRGSQAALHVTKSYQLQSSLAKTPDSRSRILRRVVQLPIFSEFFAAYLKGLKARYFGRADEFTQMLQKSDSYE